MVSCELVCFEKVFGLQLFEWICGCLQLMVQGLCLFEEVQCFWYGLDCIVSVVESLCEFCQGELLIVCLLVFFQFFLLLLLLLFFVCYLEVSLQIVFQELLLLEEWFFVQCYDFGLMEILYIFVGIECILLLMLNEVCVLFVGYLLVVQVMLIFVDFQGENYISLLCIDSYCQLFDVLFFEYQVKWWMVVEIYSVVLICVMVCVGVGILVVNLLIVLDYVDSGVVVCCFSVEVLFIVSLICFFYCLCLVLVDVFVVYLQQSLLQIFMLLVLVLQRV